MLNEISVSCPYCGEVFVTLVDTSVARQEYIEDCQVCCNPIVFDVSLDTMNGEPIVSVRRENE